MLRRHWWDVYYRLMPPLIRHFSTADAADAIGQALRRHFRWCFRHEYLFYLRRSIADISIADAGCYAIIDA